jgi:hypothetical protein
MPEHTLDLNCKDNCPFGRLCGLKVFEEHTPCMDNIKKAQCVPSDVTLHANRSMSRDVTLRVDHKKIGEVKLGVVYLFN